MVAELRAKGAIILAKSIASQVNNTTGGGPATASTFFPPSTDNGRATWGGTVCNPYDTARSPGFSSGGAGASVAANLVTCGICETTGGSCRIPAAFCGLVGFKPTASRVPTQGAFPLSSSLDSVGPMAATVACCAALDAVLAGEPVEDLAPFPLDALMYQAHRQHAEDGARPRRESVLQDVTP